MNNKKENWKIIIRNIVLSFIIAIFLIGVIHPEGFYEGDYIFSKESHSLVRINLEDDGTFTSYEASDADMGGLDYYGTYQNKGILVLNYEKCIINADDFEIKDYSKLTKIGDNKYEEKVNKTGYAIVIGNRFISFKNPKAILKKD